MNPFSREFTRLMNTNTNFLSTVGERYQDFVLNKIVPIDELHCTLRELVHEPSGAVVMQIANDDPENLFCLSFRTLPTSSNGAAHILEHTVLCGSRKFPVKDPFFVMSRRSLNTFMNALTGADFTCYPASSQVEKDFYNLLDVYLDAVFHPQLKELSFIQEGHRLEFTDPEDSGSPLEFKGIVYNEMKGSMASPDTRLWHTLTAELMPDLPYAYNSGGDPEEIPNLTYAELIHFHETYYHPSRCLFFFYGNIPLTQHLDFLAEKALKNVPQEPPIPHLLLQKRFTAPRRKLLAYPVDKDDTLDRKTIQAFGWLTVPLTEQEELLALAVLDCVLMDNDASPLKARLLASNLCVQADAILDVEMSEVPYVIICKGCRPHETEQLESYLLKELEKIAEKGLPKNLIEAAIHQIEFARTEISSDQIPFGLTLFMRSALAKQHGCPAENALTLHALFDNLVKKIQDPDYLPSLLRKHLVHNKHRVTLTMYPDPHLASEEASREKEKLIKIREHLTPVEEKHILLQTRDLAQYQNEKERQELDCLPKVTLADVPPHIRDFPLSQKKYGSLEIFHHDCFTNHILYADLLFDLPEISQENLPYVQLLCSLLPDLGAGNRDYSENLEYIQAHTGGLNIFVNLHPQVDLQLPLRPCITIRSKSLARKSKELFTLLREEATTARFDDTDRLMELIDQIHVSLSNRLGRNASRYSIQTALSGFNSICYINQAWHGLDYFYAIRAIAEQARKDPKGVTTLLRNLYEQIFCLQSPHLVLSCDNNHYEKLIEANFYGLDSLQPKPAKTWKDHFVIPHVGSQLRSVASPVAFTCEAFHAPTLLDPAAPALHIASQLFENKILHSQIREKGGAYGSSATYSPTLAYFFFHSYRDPNILATWQVFHEAILAISGGGFDDEDLEEAKLGLIQQFDTPISPGSRAFTAYSWWRDGRTAVIRQHYRDQLLHMQKAEVIKAVQEHLVPQLTKGVFVGFAGNELIDKELPLLHAAGRTLNRIPI